MSTKRKIGAVVIMRQNMNNYGTSLQGFATVKILEQLGYDYDIIRYTKKDGLRRKLRHFFGYMRSGGAKRCMVRLKLKMNRNFNAAYVENFKIRCGVVNAFKAKYLDINARDFPTYKSLREGSKNYSVIFVGSDQVWGPLSLYAGFFNLLFVDKSVPTFSYSSSFGVSQIFPWQRKGVAEFLNKLNKIGVREERGKEIVKELTGRDATVVLDPTLLLSKESWLNFLPMPKHTVDKPYILTYLLGRRKEIRDEVESLSRELNMPIVNFPHVDHFIDFDEDFGDRKIYDADALDFLNLLNGASFVITDSFHCSVFSILFHKKFMTYYRQNPNEKGSTHSRIDNLLGMFSLENRLGGKNLTEKIQAEINYDLVDEKLKEKREISLQFLKEGLELKKE